MNKLIAILLLLAAGIWEDLELDAIWRDLTLSIRAALHPWEVLDAEMREQGLCGWPA